MDMDESLPETQPEGSLVPPPRVPPTAVATAAPLPPSSPRLSLATRRSGVFAMVNRALDQLDTLADRIADAVGLR
jgi:hypothetical protein